MKFFHSLTAAASLLVLSLACGWLASGCAAPSGGFSAPKPGSGIAEYRKVARDAHRSVAAVVDSLEAMPRSSTRPALARFDRAFSDLELTSIKARARAEAIIARGQAYFDEWKGNLTSITNQASSKAETDRHNRLLDQFERVRQRSSAMREEFRPFMAKAREFRARLDSPPGPAEGELFGKELDGLAAGGRRVLQTLESVAKALDEAEAELHATLAAKR